MSAFTQKIRLFARHCFVLFLLIISGANGEVISLETFLADVDQAPDVDFAKLDHTANAADVKRQSAAQSWELFGGAGIALVNEAVDETRSREHTDLSARIGLRYPLIGGNRVDKRALRIAEGNERISEIRLAQSSSLVRRQIETAYGQYWAAQNKVTLCDAYSQFADEIKQILVLRRDAGLLLESDRQEFLSGFERVNHIRVQQQSLQMQALNKLRRLTGLDWPAFEAIKPPFYEAPVGTLDEDFVGADHAELRIIEAELETQQQILEETKLDQVDVDFVVSTSVTDELSGPSGYGLLAGINFRMPLFYGEYKSADESFVTASIRKSEFSHRQRRALLIEQARLNESLYRDYTQRLQLNKVQWDAMRRVVSERSRRVKRLDGDVLSELVGSMYRYFTQSIELLDVQMKLWNAQAALRQFPLWMDRLLAGERIVVPDYKAMSDVIFVSQNVLKRTANSVPDSPLTQVEDNRYGVYLWQSKEILNHADNAFWQQIRDQHVGRILLSLDAAQIEQVVVDPAALRSFLAEAEGNSVAVELLLGDPEWARPEQRNGLFDIITQLSDLPFDGLNLDIEVDSLTTEVTDTLLNDWLDTLRLSNMLSPWPVAITLHYRYLQTLPDSLCVPCELMSFGIKDITAMTFVSNPARVIEIMEPILASYPKLRISVAQSFERHLSREESYASFSEQEAHTRLAQIQSRLGASDNFGGITIQSWFNFRKLD